MDGERDREQHREDAAECERADHHLAGAGLRAQLGEVWAPAQHLGLGQPSRVEAGEGDGVGVRRRGRRVQRVARAEQEGDRGRIVRERRDALLLDLGEAAQERVAAGGLGRRLGREGAVGEGALEHRVVAAGDEGAQQRDIDQRPLDLDPPERVQRVVVRQRRLRGGGSSVSVRHRILHP